MAKPYLASSVAPADATGYEQPLQEFKMGGEYNFVPRIGGSPNGMGKQPHPMDILPEQPGDATAYQDMIARESNAATNRTVMRALMAVAEGAIDGPGMLLRELAAGLYGDDSEGSVERMLVENADLFAMGPLALLKEGGQKAFLRLKDDAKRAYDDMAQFSREAAGRRLDKEYGGLRMGGDPQRIQQGEEALLALREGRSGTYGHLPATPAPVTKTDIDAAASYAEEMGVSPYASGYELGPYRMKVAGNDGVNEEAVKLLSDNESWRYARELDPQEYVIPGRAGDEARRLAQTEEAMAMRMGDDYSPMAFIDRSPRQMVDVESYGRALEMDPSLAMDALRMNPTTRMQKGSWSTAPVTGPLREAMPYARESGTMPLQAAQEIFGNPLLTNEQKLAAFRMLQNPTPEAWMSQVAGGGAFSPGVRDDVSRRFLGPMQQRVDASDAALSGMQIPALPFSDDLAMEHLMSKLSLTESDLPWLKGGGFQRPQPFGQSFLEAGPLAQQGTEYLASPAMGSPLYMLNPQGRYSGLETNFGEIAPVVRGESMRQMPDLQSIFGRDPNARESSLFGGINLRF